MDHITEVVDLSVGKRKWFPSSNLTDCKSVTFTVDIEIVGQSDINTENYEYDEVVDSIDLAQMLNDARGSYGDP